MYFVHILAQKKKSLIVLLMKKSNLKLKNNFRNSSKNLPNNQKPFHALNPPFLDQDLMYQFPHHQKIADRRVLCHFLAVEVFLKDQLMLEKPSRPYLHHLEGIVQQADWKYQSKVQDVAAEHLVQVHRNERVSVQCTEEK